MERFPAAVTPPGPAFVPGPVDGNASAAPGSAAAPALSFIGNGLEKDGAAAARGPEPDALTARRYRLVPPAVPPPPRSQSEAEGSAPVAGLSASRVRPGSERWAPDLAVEPEPCTGPSCTGGNPGPSAMAEAELEICSTGGRRGFGIGGREIGIAGSAFRHHDLGVRHVTRLVGDGGTNPERIGGSGVPPLGAQQ